MRDFGLVFAAPAYWLLRSRHTHTHTHKAECEVLMLLLLGIQSSSLLLGNFNQSHFISQLHYWFDSHSQHCAAGIKSCTARPSSINKLSMPEGCVCVWSSLLWLESWIWSSFWLCSVTHTQHQTKDKTVRGRVCLQSRLDQLNYKPWTSTLSGEAWRNAGGGDPGLAGGSVGCSM